MRRRLEVHPTQDICSRGREEFLADSQRDAMSGKLVLMKRLHKVAPCIFENKWPKDLNAREGRGNERHFLNLTVEKDPNLTGWTGLRGCSLLVDAIRHH